MGPGDSIGIGIAALISGADKYYALDVIDFANKKNNIKIFKELVELFKKREDIPSEKEFPDVKPYLDSYEFPHHIFQEDDLKIKLNTQRLETLKNAILGIGNSEDSINIRNNNIDIIYAVPWTKYDISVNDSIDLIYSQAVLEHVDDLENTYHQMYRWLKPGGFMSHVIDFKCHGTAKKWNGHWAYSDSMWNFIRGRRHYLLNREPFSTHIKLLNKNKFKIINIKKVNKVNGINKNTLNKKFDFLTDEDLCTSSALLQSIK